MPRRLLPLVNDNIYHLFNRGVEKRKTFVTSDDYNRFKQTLEHYLPINPVVKLSRKGLLKTTVLSEDNQVEILAFCLMPNHFHLLVRQLNTAGISTYISRVTNSYTRYFNTKNDRVGPLFQGQFKAVHVDSDEQLLHLSRYIHLNPYVAGLTQDLKSYHWSSYPSYLGDNNNQFVSRDEILSYFPSEESYNTFVLDQADYGLTLEKLKHSKLD